MLGHSAQHHTEQQIQECIRSCTECHQVCLENAMHAVAVGGRHASEGHVGLLLDCADVADVTARFLSRRSELHGYVCRACFAVAARCADECEQLGMLTCAEACRRCAEACAQLAVGQGASTLPTQHAFAAPSRA